MNPNPSAPTMRALVVAMQRWINGTAEPPQSAYPRLDERYASVDVYFGRYTEVTLALMRRGFLLPEDVASVVERGREEFRYVAEGLD